jgi:hypothetical protein
VIASALLADGLLKPTFTQGDDARHAHRPGGAVDGDGPELDGCRIGRHRVVPIHGDRRDGWAVDTRLLGRPRCAAGRQQQCKDRKWP